MPRERQIIAAIKYQLKMSGWTTWNNQVSAFNEGGLPDLMAIRDGIFLAIEVKRPGYKPTPLQDLWLRRINSQGGIAFYASSVRDAEAQLKRMLEERRIENEKDRIGGSDGSGDGNGSDGE